MFEEIGFQPSIEYFRDSKNKKIPKKLLLAKSFLKRLYNTCGRVHIALFPGEKYI